MAGGNIPFGPVRRRQAQFIGASRPRWIYQFCTDGIARVKYAETEHFQATRDFLNRHERMREVLLAAEDDDLKSKKRK